MPVAIPKWAQQYMQQKVNEGNLDYNSLGENAKKVLKAPPQKPSLPTLLPSSTGALRRMDDTSVAPLAPKPPSLSMAAFHDTESRGSMGLLDDSSIGSRGTDLHDVTRDLGTAAKAGSYNTLARSVFERFVPSNNAGGLLEQQAQEAKSYQPQTLAEKAAYGAGSLITDTPAYLLGGEIIGAPIAAGVTRALPTAGRALPVLKAGRLTVGPVLSGTGAAVLGRAAGGYATGAALGGSREALEGGSLGDVLQGASQEGKLWAGGELGIAGLSGLAKALSKKPELLKIKNLDLTPKRGLTGVEEEAFKTGQDLGQNMNVQRPSLPTNQGQASANLPLGIGGARRIPEKMEPVGSGQRVRSLGVSVTNAKSTVPEVQRDLINEMVPGGRGVYNVHSNERTVEWADRIVKADPQEALRYVKENPGTDLSNTVALKLVKKANAEGKFNDATDIIQHISQVATNQGQAIQALRLWGNMTPEGMQRYYVRTIESINRDMEKKLGNKAKKLQVKPEIMQQLKENMEKIGSMVDGREKDIELAKTLDLVAAEVPVSFLSKVALIQTMAQLLNPKTAMRNIVGNFGFAGLENISGTVGAGIDKALSLATKQRTKVLPSLTAQAKGFKQGWKHGLEDALLGIDTSGLSGKFDLPKGKVFRGGILGTAEKALNIELRATDRAFYRAAYEDSLLNQMRAAKTNTPTEEMLNTAHHDALYRTFQDDNALSQLFTGVKRLLNANKEFGVGDFIIKYPRTPANLLMRGIDYSPAGFMKTVIEAARPLAGQKFNQKAFVESFSRALVGSTALFGTGALLHKLGVITGRPVEDRDLAELQREQGFGEYRINASALKRLVFGNGDTGPQKGDNIISYDWFQPQAIPLAIGADVDANKGDASGIVGTILNALGTGLNAFAEQPVVQGLQTLFSGGYGEIDKGLVKVLEGVPSSFVPTLLNQIKQLVDNQRRETYDPNSTQKALNLAKNKVPGLALKLPQKYGTLGQPLETYQGGSNNPLNVFLNPAFVNRYNPTPTVQKINDLYNKTGEAKHVPRVVPKNITVSGKQFILTGPEYAQYQKRVGELTQAGFDKMSGTLTPDEAVNSMQKIMTDANTQAKMEILKARGVNVKKKSNGLSVQ
jgi:hypothetical protein